MTRPPYARATVLRRTAPWLALMVMSCPGLASGTGSTIRCRQHGLRLEVAGGLLPDALGHRQHRLIADVVDQHTGFRDVLGRINWRYERGLSAMTWFCQARAVATIGTLRPLPPATTVTSHSTCPRLRGRAALEVEAELRLRQVKHVIDAGVEADLKLLDRHAHAEGKIAQEQRTEGAPRARPRSCMAHHGRTAAGRVAGSAADARIGSFVIDTSTGIAISRVAAAGAGADRPGSARDGPQSTVPASMSHRLLVHRTGGPCRSSNPRSGCSPCSRPRRPASFAGLHA